MDPTDIVWAKARRLISSFGVKGFVCKDDTRQWLFRKNATAKTNTVKPVIFLCCYEYSGVAQVNNRRCWFAPQPSPIKDHRRFVPLVSRSPESGGHYKRQPLTRLIRLSKDIVFAFVFRVAGFFSVAKVKNVHHE